MATTTVHRLKVTLRGVKPPVWRRIEVASDTKLSDLAGMLEGAMGWLGGHLHAFEAEDATYELPNEDSIGFRRTFYERMVMLADVLSTVSSKMRWDYDFGDLWQPPIAGTGPTAVPRHGSTWSSMRSNQIGPRRRFIAPGFVGPG